MTVRPLAIRNLPLAWFGPLLYLLTVSSLAALLAYPIFVISGSTDISFFRTLVSRGGQLLLLLGIYPLDLWLGLGWRQFGLRRGFPGQWLTGFALGTLMLGLHVLVLIELDVRELLWPRLSPLRWTVELGKAVAVGFGVALLEESIFRGALVGIVRRLSGPVHAVVISAFYYAGLHFIGTRWSTDLSLVGWDTGFRIALDGFSHLAQAPPDAFLGLFVAGLFLASLRVLIPGSLGLCMGVHAGWVFIIKVAKPLTQINAQSPHFHLVGSYDHVVGYLSSAWLSLLLAIILVTFTLRRRRSHATHNA